MCKPTHIAYVCFMYVYTTILPRVQRVKQQTSSTSVSCVRYNYIASRATCKATHIVYIYFMYYMQLYYLMYNV